MMSFTRHLHNTLPMRAKGNAKTVTEEICRLISLSSNVKYTSKNIVSVEKAAIFSDHCQTDEVTVDPWESSDLAWSDEMTIIKTDALNSIKKGRTKRYSKETIRPVIIIFLKVQQIFKTIRLHGRNIKVMDDELATFNNLTYLSLNGNMIVQCGKLPNSIQFLALNANMYLLLI